MKHQFYFNDIFNFKLHFIKSRRHQNLTATALKNNKFVDNHFKVLKLDIEIKFVICFVTIHGQAVVVNCIQF